MGLSTSRLPGTEGEQSLTSGDGASLAAAGSLGGTTCRQQRGLGLCPPSVSRVESMLDCVFPQLLGGARPGQEKCGQGFRMASQGNRGATTTTTNSTGATH